MAGEIVVTAAEAAEGARAVTAIAKVAAGCVQRRMMGQAEIEQMRDAVNYARAMRRRGYLRALADATLTDIEDLSKRIYEMERSGGVSQRAISAAYGVLEGYVADMEAVKAKMLGGVR